MIASECEENGRLLWETRRTCWWRYDVPPHRASACFAIDKGSRGMPSSLDCICGLCSCFALDKDAPRLFVLVFYVRRWWVGRARGEHEAGKSERVQWSSRRIRRRCWQSYDIPPHPASVCFALNKGAGGSSALRIERGRSTRLFVRTRFAFDRDERHLLPTIFPFHQGAGIGEESSAPTATTTRGDVHHPRLLSMQMQE